MYRFLSVLMLVSAFTSAQWAVAAPTAYKGAEIYSNQSYTYGRYEIRMQVAKGDAVLSTFFTYKNGSEVGNTFWEEIDIEVFGKNNATEWQSNIILGSSRPTIQAEKVHSADSSLAEAYHTYVLEWTPDYVAWFLDGTEVRRITGTSTVTSLTNAQSLRLNLWASSAVDWVGQWDHSILPVYQFVNYIDYKAYNPETKTFEGGWRDDFDSFDSTRWSKANWTFDTNLVEFSPDNLVVKDGILILAMTTADATGFTGTPPADDPGSSSFSSISSAASNQSSAPVASSSVASSSVASSQAQSSESSAPSSTATSSRASGNGGGGSGGGGALNGLGLILLAGLGLIQIGRARRIHIAL
jgi:endo-1,3-1,4-beta-glycanase ExoK